MTQNTNGRHVKRPERAVVAQLAKVSVNACKGRKFKESADAVRIEQSAAGKQALIFSLAIIGNAETRPSVWNGRKLIVVLFKASFSSSSESCSK